MLPLKLGAYCVGHVSYLHNMLLSMVECLTRYRWVAGSSLTWSTALCSWTWHFILCSVLVSPDEVGGGGGGIVLATSVCPPFCLPACLSTCPPRNIPKYLLVIVDAFSVWMDSTMDSPISYKFRQNQLIKTLLLWQLQCKSCNGFLRVMI